MLKVYRPTEKAMDTLSRDRRPSKESPNLFERYWACRQDIDFLKDDELDKASIELLALLKESIEDGCVVHCANVDAGMDSFFRLTNSIDAHWSENKQVQITVRNFDDIFSYSTSIGDIFSDGNDDYYLVTAYNIVKLN